MGHVVDHGTKPVGSSLRGLVGIVSFVLLCAVPALALDPARAITQYGHDNWQTAQGLPQNTIQAIAQTPDGYLWIGTQEGLARFNGARFQVYHRRNTPAILNQDVHALAVGPDGGLWIGTEDGLLLYKDGAFRRFSEKDGLPSDRILSLAVDRQNVVWVGTRGSGLVRGDHLAFQKISLGGRSRENVWAVAMGTDAVWAATATGLVRYRHGQITRFTEADGLPNNLATSLVESRGTLWVGTVKGVARLVGERFEAAPNPDAARANVHSLLGDRQGNLWVGTAGAGLLRVQGPAAKLLEQGSQLTANYVVSLFEDREGSLWIGTESGGLDRLKDTKMTVIGPAEGLLGTSGRLVLQRRDGSMVLATEEGITVADEKGVRPLLTKAQLGNVAIQSMIEDHAGDLWFGTPNGSVKRLHQGIQEVFPFGSWDLVPAIFEDRDQKIWVGTTAGLKKLDGKKWLSYSVSDGLAHRYVRAIEQDAAGAMWLGTYGGGVSRFYNGVFETFNKKAGLSSDLVESLHVSKDGTVWVGTADAGLNAIRKGKIVRITAQQGLFDDRIFQIVEDSQGTLWMGCNRGVFSLSKSELDRFIEGRSTTIQSQAYGEADGMRSAECNGGQQPSGWLARDGRVWIPTVKGFVMIDPGHVQPNREPAPVVIEQARADGVELGSQGVRIRPGTRSIEIDYAGLSFLAPEKVHFRYQLAGFDPNWVDASTRRTAYYTNVPPGSYQFRVTASNNDGLWNATGASIGLRVEPSFYQTYWFGLLCGACILAFIWAGYSLRLRQLRFENQLVLEERARVARELHDTLLQGFSGVSMQLEALSRRLGQRAEVESKQLSEILKTVDHCLADARDSVWDLRSPLLEHNDLAGALDRLCREANTENQAVRFQQTGRLDRLPIAISTQLLRIGQELLTNAQRHSHADTITMTLEANRREVRLEVKDNGVGLPSERQKVDHWGLIGIAERAKQIDGKLDICTAPLTGTSVALTAPRPTEKGRSKPTATGVAGGPGSN